MSLQPISLKVGSPEWEEFKKTGRLPKPEAWDGDEPTAEQHDWYNANGLGQLPNMEHTAASCRSESLTADSRPNDRTHGCKSLGAPLISFVVPGNPIGAPRMTQGDKWKRRPCVIRYRAWKDSARLNAGHLPAADDVVSLSWVAVFSPPQSWSQKKRLAVIGQQHRCRPDRDNIDKAILDALFPGGDQAIAAGSMRKEWGVAEGLYVTIEVINGSRI